MTGFRNIHHSRSTKRIIDFLRSINHYKQQAHDAEIELGADQDLHMLLVDAVSDNNGGLVANSELSKFTSRQRQQITIICKTIEMLYLCSKEKAEMSFNRIGSDFLDVFSVILSIELRTHSLYHQQAIARNDSTIKAVTRIVSRLARLHSAATVMAQHRLLITHLEGIIECSKGTISFESQHNALWILANVACDKKNSMFLLSTNKRLLHTLARVANDPGNIIDTQSRSTWSHSYQAIQLQRTALRCLLNLSFVEETADQMMYHSITILPSLCQIIALPTAPFRNISSVVEMIVQVKQYACGILYNLSNTSDDNRKFLCSFDNGALMKSLREATDNDDAVVQRKATLTLANLVIFNRFEDISKYSPFTSYIKSS
eukprot:scaffold20874_cov48-Cyclotella_meneghiniana.AAC.2